jgi:hypothetical protein
MSADTRRPKRNSPKESSCCDATMVLGTYVLYVLGSFAGSVIRGLTGAGTYTRRQRVSDESEAAA